MSKKKGAVALAEPEKEKKEKAPSSVVLEAIRARLHRKTEATITFTVGTLCPVCGLGVLVDDDGCCAECGATAHGPGADEAIGWATWALAEIERLGRGVAKLQSTSDQLGRHRGHQRKGCYVCDEARAALDYDGKEDHNAPPQ